MILEPVILVPWGISQLRSVPLATVVIPGFWEVAWITVVMMSPFVMTAAVVNGLALQKVKQTTKDTYEQTSVVQKTSVNKPITREAFADTYPGAINPETGKKFTGKQVMELVGTICEKTGGNWVRYAEIGHNGDHA